MRKYLAGVFGSEINEMSCVWGSRAAWNARQKPYALHKLFNSCPGQFLGRFSSCFHVGLVDGSRGFARCGGQRKGTNFNCRLHDNDNTPPHALFGGRSSSQKSEIKTQKKKKKCETQQRIRNVRIFDKCKPKSRHVQHGFVHDCRPAWFMAKWPGQVSRSKRSVIHIQHTDCLIRVLGWDNGFAKGNTYDKYKTLLRPPKKKKKEKKKCVQKSWRSTLSDGMNNCVNRLV